jgi:hypothetical protein
VKRKIYEQTVKDVYALVRATEILRDHERTQNALNHIEENRVKGIDINITVIVNQEVQS